MYVLCMRPAIRIEYHGGMRSQRSGYVLPHDVQNGHLARRSLESYDYRP